MWSLYTGENTACCLKKLDVFMGQAISLFRIYVFLQRYIVRMKLDRVCLVHQLKMALWQTNG